MRGACGTPGPGAVRPLVYAFASASESIFPFPQISPGSPPHQWPEYLLEGIEYPRAVLPHRHFFLGTLTLLHPLLPGPFGSQIGDRSIEARAGLKGPWGGGSPSNPRTELRRDGGGRLRQ